MVILLQAPTNRLPGDTIEKQIIATNTGNVDQAVRISLTEAWTPSNSNSTLIKAGDYYYYNYKLAPNEFTSALIDSVIFNSKTKLNDTCVTTTNGSTKTVTCNSSGSDYDNATYILTFNIETVQYNKYQEAWSTNFAIASEKPSSEVDYLLSNEINADGAAYNEQTKSKMFKMTHPSTAQTPAQTEYRYIGDAPNNYVYFNCDSLDNQNSNTCEVWRIIGVFDVDDGTGNYEQRIKLVRGSALPDAKQWDTRTSEMYPNENYGKNEWGDSLIQTYLNDNGNYYMRSGSATNYGLKATAKNLISDAKYYLGGMHESSNGYGTADAIYLWKRGNETFSYDTYCLYYNSNGTRCTTENYCESNPTDEVCNATRSKFWVGKVALMYLSDQYLVYANDVDYICYDNPYNCSEKEPWGAPKENPGYPQKGWIYNSNNLEGQTCLNNIWFLSSYSSYSYRMFGVYFSGTLGDSWYASESKGVRPVLYLSSNVKITSGTGEKNNPFKLGL